MTKKTFYGFDYDHVQASMSRYMPYVIEDVNHLVDELMSNTGADFMCSDELLDNFDDTHGWIDQELYYRANLEIIRQLSGFLFQCLPPVLSDHEEPFLLPHQLVPEYVDTWMSDIANSGYDDRQRVHVEFFENGGYERLLAEHEAKQKTIRGRIASVASKVKRIWGYAVRTMNE